MRHEDRDVRREVAWAAMLDDVPLDMEDFEHIDVPLEARPESK